MSGSINGLMNGAPCWSPAPRSRYDLKLTPSERLKVDLLEMPNLIQAAIAKGLVKLPSKDAELETPRQKMAAFPAAIEAAIKAGLVCRPEPVPEKPKRVYGGPTTKACKCGAQIHIYSTICRACYMARAGNPPEKPCEYCGKIFPAVKSKCCSRECGNLLRARRITEAALRKRPRPPQICIVCGVEFPWRYTGTKLPAKTCTLPCTKEAARRNMRTLGSSRKKN